MARNAILLAAALSTGWGCASTNAPVDIGDGVTGESLRDYAASWEGYAEAYTFADGSDKVRLMLDPAGNGTLQIGDSPALPIATDPNVGYPASYVADYTMTQYSELFPGFAYAVDTATVQSARIQFTLNPWQIAREWCALQTPYDQQGNGAGGAGGASNGGGGAGGSAGYGFIPANILVGPDSGGWGLGRYLCLPPQAHSPACTATGNPPVTVNCAKGAMCWNGLCSCDAQSCSFYVPPSGARATRAQLDAALDNGGKSLVGTLKIGNAGQVSMTVRLKRTSNH